jgi:chromobox protein 1
MCRDGAEDAVKEYYAKLGGRPEPPTAKPGRGKRKSMTTSAKPTPERTTTKKQKLSKQEINGTEISGADIPRGIPDWVGDKDHWEEDVMKVQTIEHDGVHGGLVAYLNWTNGKTTKVSIGLCYEKIPLMVSWPVSYFVSQTLTLFFVLDAQILRSTSVS